MPFVIVNAEGGAWKPSPGTFKTYKEAEVVVLQLWAEGYEAYVKET